MSEPNSRLLEQARANVKARNNPAHWRSIDNGDWDNYSVRAEVERLLREPKEIDGEEE